jgi:hypothetical protein
VGSWVCSLEVVKVVGYKDSRRAGVEALGERARGAGAAGKQQSLFNGAR